MRTIRQRFYLVAILLGLLLSLNYGLIVYYLDRQEEATQKRDVATSINEDAKELEKHLWTMRFWEKSVISQNPDATQHFTKILADIRKSVQPFELKLLGPNMKENVQSFLKLLSQYEGAFNQLIQVNTDAQLNRTNLNSAYQMLTSNIMMENAPKLIKLLFNLARFQDDYLISRKETQYKGLLIVISSIERRATATQIMNDRLRTYFSSYRDRLEQDRYLDQKVNTINNIFDDTTLKLADNLSNISKSALEEANRGTQIAKEIFQELKLTFLLIAISGILIFFIIIYLLYIKIVRPIGALSTVAHSVKTGDMKARFSSTEKDEISMLGQAFNEMVESINMQNTKLRVYQQDLERNIDQLDRSQKELQKHRTKLEEMVENRTKDLELANKQLQEEILERKQFEDALRIARDEAEAANRIKSEFLANMSHELRTPLNHIIGFTDLVVAKRVGDLNEIQEEYLTDALSSSHLLLDLINDILDISKIEAGKMEIDPTKFDLKELLHNSFNMIKEKALKHQIKLESSFSRLPETIIADSRKIKQIMYNLLSNAAKFTPDGGTICLSAEELSFSQDQWYDSALQPVVALDSNNMDYKAAVPGPWIKISVKDTGIGILPEDLKRIFNPFEQVENCKTKRFQGTGLGLSLTQSFVEMHGGAIWAESEGAGQGCTFSLILPIDAELGKSGTGQANQL